MKITTVRTRTARHYSLRDFMFVMAFVLVAATSYGLEKHIENSDKILEIDYN